MRGIPDSAPETPSHEMNAVERTQARLSLLAHHMPRDTDSPFWSVQIIASTHSGVRRAGETIVNQANSAIGAALHAMASTTIQPREGEDLTLFVQTAREVK